MRYFYPFTVGEATVFCEFIASIDQIFFDIHLYQLKAMIHLDWLQVHPISWQVHHSKKKYLSLGLSFKAATYSIALQVVCTSTTIPWLTFAIILLHFLHNSYTHSYWFSIFWGFHSSEQLSIWLCCGLRYRDWEIGRVICWRGGWSSVASIEVNKIYWRKAAIKITCQFWNSCSAWKSASF